MGNSNSQHGLSRDLPADRRSLLTRFKMALAPYVPRFIQYGWRRLKFLLNRILPKGLFARSLIIILAPVLILQSVLTLVFLDRHWELTTRRLSAGVVRDMSAAVELWQGQYGAMSQTDLVRLLSRDLDMQLNVLPGDQLERMPTGYDLLRSSLIKEIEQRIHHPSSVNLLDDWVVEVRIYINDQTLRFLIPRDNAYATNWHIFLVWMVTTSLVLVLVSVLFLRNQIRPIERLANAMDRFGKGQTVGNFHPAGAREVRRAAQAFQDMRRRIERQVEQRTTMLAGVSHDLRTILTRFRLELAFFGDDPEAEAMRRDADEMEAMLEAYLAFARGDADEERVTTDVEAIFTEAVQSARRIGAEVQMRFTGWPEVSLRPGAFRRLLDNLIGNAVRYGERVAVEAVHAGGYLRFTVDDDGPGIPQAAREDVFRPFYRLDTARNQDEGGTGLGLAIVRDIARAHGGEVTIDESPLGGCRAMVRIPG